MEEGVAFSMFCVIRMDVGAIDVGDVVDVGDVGDDGRRQSTSVVIDVGAYIKDV